MNLQKDSTQQHSIENKQTLQSKHTVAKTFIRTPSGNFNLNVQSKIRGTSIGKYWQVKTCDSARQYSLAQSELFTQSSSAKEIPLSNGKNQPKHTNKFFKKVMSKEIRQEDGQTKKDVITFNFSKTPKNIKLEKTQFLQFSYGKAIRSKKNIEHNSIQKSTQNSDNSGTYCQKQPFDISTILKFKGTSKLCLSQFIDKDISETQIIQQQIDETPIPRRGSFYLQQKNHMNRGQGLPTNAVTRQIGGGTFSNSYPTNNPFLKFKVAQKIAINRSKILSHKHLDNLSSYSFESKKQFHSEKDIYQFKRNPVQKRQFQIGKRLGKGKYGDVFLVKHRQTGFICAMKIIQKDLVKRQKVQNQICRQMKISSFINHTNTTTLYGYFHDEANVYLLMQLCSQGNLYNILKQIKRLPQQNVVTGIKQICQGIQYLHTQNIIHRDIKPENIIVENGFLKLCDFGWAVYSCDRLRTTFCGTPLYVSPEVLKGDDYNQKIDIWAIGILTYELLVGRVPFKINSEADMAKIIFQQIQFPDYIQISDIAKDFILRILNRDAQNRIDIQEVLAHPFLKQQCSDLFLF